MFYKRQETEASKTFPESTFDQTESGPCTNNTGFGSQHSIMQSFYIVKLCSKGQFVERNLPRWFSFPRTGLVCSRGNLHKYIVVSNCWTNPSSLILDPHLPVSLCIIIQGAMQITCHKKNKKKPHQGHISVHLEDTKCQNPQIP